MDRLKTLIIHNNATVLEENININKEIPFKTVKKFFFSI